MTPALPPIHSLNETNLREVILRTVKLSDLKYITNSWLESYRRAPAVTAVPNKSYYRFQHLLIEHLIPDSRIIVAAGKSEPDRIYGWLVSEYTAPTLTLHYVYVRLEARNYGLGSALITEAFRQASQQRTKPNQVIWTHQTQSGRRFMESFGPRLLSPLPYEYNPYALIFAPASPEKSQ